MSKVSDYLKKGTFFLATVDGDQPKVRPIGAFTKDEEGRYVIKTRIPYESKETYEAMKKFVEGTKE